MKFFSLLTFLFLQSLAGLSQQKCNVNLDSVFIKVQRSCIELADSLATQNLEIKTRRKDIPRFVRKTMKCWFGEFKIADVGKSFNPTDVVWNNLPRRRIKFLGLNNEYIILAYEQGGIGKTDHIDVIKFKNRKILKYWSGYDYILGEITTDNIIEHIYYSIKSK
jgi:hypothetical protein